MSFTAKQMIEDATDTASKLFDAAYKKVGETRVVHVTPEKMIPLVAVHMLIAGADYLRQSIGQDIVKLYERIKAEEQK